MRFFKGVERPNIGIVQSCSTDRNWRISLMKHNSFYENRELADLEIVCGTKTFKVHGSIIRPKSDYFAAAFFGGYKVCASFPWNGWPLLMTTQ